MVGVSLASKFRAYKNVFHAGEGRISVAVRTGERHETSDKGVYA